jgi:hypothetical protein
LWRFGVGLGKGAFRVGFTQNPAAFHRTARQRGAENVGITIAARIIVDAWRPDRRSLPAAYLPGSAVQCQAIRRGRFRLRRLL